jgi:hypothetical protein
MKKFKCGFCLVEFNGYRNQYRNTIYCSKKCYWQHRKLLPSNRKGAKMTFEQRTKMSMSKMGDKNSNWRGGVSIFNRTERYNEMSRFRYREWRKKVFERDDYVCQECGAK